MARRIAEMPIPRPKEVLKEEIKELLRRLSDQYDRIRKKRRDNSKLLEIIIDKWIDLRNHLFGLESVLVKRGTPEHHLAVRVAEDSIRDIEDLLKTLSEQF